MFEQLIDASVVTMIKEVAYEAYQEGRTAKGFAEKKSGIMIPFPVYMQFNTYSSLADIWRNRKEYLRTQIEINRGKSSKLLATSSNPPPVKRDALTGAQIKKIKQEKKARKLELERQEQLCTEMRLEEILCKDFYRWELVHNLRERRLMREEERKMRELCAEEEKRRLEADNIYNQIAGTDETDTNKNFSYDKRRKELKELAIERRRRAEDQAYMMLEDKMGEVLREIDRVERQRKKFEAEFGADDDDKEEVSEEIEKMRRISFMNDFQLRRSEIEVPTWLTIPNAWSAWDNYQRNKFIRMMVRIKLKNERTQKKLEKDEKRLKRLEERSYREWEDRFTVVEQKELEAELAMMEADEEKREAESKLVDVNENVMKILIYCREKGEEELHSKTELKKRQEIARTRDQELADAEAWLELCMRRARNRDKLKRRVSSDCKWVDTESINGFHQRFATERLRARLYLTYFKQIISSVVNRAEIIATERKLLLLQEKLSYNKHCLVERSTAMKSVMHEMRRDDYMRMRRSFLNEKLFGLSRKRVLQERFGGWVRYYLWNRGHKEAFQLKYEVIKRQLDIDRQFKRQLQTKAEKEKEKENELQESKGKKFQTIMQKHRERPLQCRYCLHYYIESQNVSTSCQYHPEQFTLECPHTCPNPGFTALCISHRRRRWKCCGAIHTDAPGCAKRYHKAIDNDPVYDKIMKLINHRDEEYLAELDRKVEIATENNFEGKLHTAKTSKRLQIEEEITRDREIAQRFLQLKFL